MKTIGFEPISRASSDWKPLLLIGKHAFSLEPRCLEFHSNALITTDIKKHAPKSQAINIFMYPNNICQGVF